MLPPFIPQKDTMIPYMAQKRHLLNSQVLAIFNASGTIPAMLHYSRFENLSSLKFMVLGSL